MCVRVHYNLVCLKTWEKSSEGVARTEKTDNGNETNKGEQRQRDQRNGDRGGGGGEKRITHGYWSRTRHSNRETMIKQKWQEKKVSNRFGSETEALWWRAAFCCCCCCCTPEVETRINCSLRLFAADDCRWGLTEDDCDPSSHFERPIKRDIRHGCDETSLLVYFCLLDL